MPPIIFAAGYNLRKNYFFENFGIILYYGIIGTVLAFLIISSFGIMLNEWNLFFFEKLNISDMLQLAAVLCATDTVAALTLVKESQFPQLNSILFGIKILAKIYKKNNIFIEIEI